MPFPGSRLQPEPVTSPLESQALDSGFWVWPLAGVRSSGGDLTAQQPGALAARLGHTLLMTIRGKKNHPRQKAGVILLSVSSGRAYCQFGSKNKLGLLQNCGMKRM
jgi:hypothetical protein